MSWRWKIFKGEESTKISKSLVWSIISENIIMSQENISQKFRLENIDETRNYLIKQIHQNVLMSGKYKKFHRILNYSKHLLILISTVPGCVSISAFAFLANIPIGNMSSAIGLKVYVITAGIKKYKSIIKKKK